MWKHPEITNTDKGSFNLQKKYRLADTLPKQLELTAIGLLIGSDYYHEIISHFDYNKPSDKN